MNRLTQAAIALCVMGSGVCRGQGQPASNQSVFQFVTSSGTGGNLMFNTETLGGKTVTAKPFLGTEERHSTQVLGDGTHIETGDTNKIYRDDAGRTRVERDGGKFVTINDPVGGMTAELDTVNKTVRKSMVRTVYQVRTDGPVPTPEQLKIDQLKKQTAEAAATPHAVMLYTGPETVTTNAVTIGGSSAAIEGEMHAKMIAEAGTTATFVARADKLGAEAKTAREDLGTQMVNGVMAHGTRSTLNIPIGQIGNDRAIQVVSEQWFSSDLQMMVKSSNNDPRFGNTTYQLSGIVQVSPDPSLFQIPADYTPAGGVMAVPVRK